MPSLGINISVYCENCFDKETERAPETMYRSSGPFDASGNLGEVGDFYSCPRCKSTITIITQIDPGEMQNG